MSKSSEKVKEWRRNTKLKMLVCMGSKCQMCGYNRAPEALEFHHLNPSEKEFQLGQVRASICSWNKITEELKKCILLCSNCHREVHAGIASIPKDFQKFDENLLHLDENKHLLKGKETTYCPVCNNVKKNHNITCSKSCASKMRRNIDWDNIDLKDLIEVKKLTKVKIAEQLGCSDAMVCKMYKKLYFAN